MDNYKKPEYLVRNQTQQLERNKIITEIKIYWPGKIADVGISTYRKRERNNLKYTIKYL